MLYRGQIARDTQLGEDELLHLYSRATAFVMPSLFETWGSVFLEAMAMALPCIGCNCCAMPEIIRHGATGYLVEPGDVGSLLTALQSLVEDPAKARAMGEAGRQRVLSHFTWDQVAGRIVNEISSRLRANNGGTGNLAESRP